LIDRFFKAVVLLQKLYSIKSDDKMIMKGQ